MSRDDRRTGRVSRMMEKHVTGYGSYLLKILSEYYEAEYKVERTHGSD